MTFPMKEKGYFPSETFFLSQCVMIADPLLTIFPREELWNKMVVIYTHETPCLFFFQAILQ